MLPYKARTTKLIGRMLKLAVRPRQAHLSGTHVGMASPGAAG